MKRKDLPAALKAATNRFRAVSYLAGILAIAVIVWALVRPPSGFWAIAAVAAALLALLGVTMLAYRSFGRVTKDIAQVIDLLCQDGYYRLEGDLYGTVRHCIESKQDLQHLVVKLQTPSLSQTLQSRVRDTYMVAEQVDRHLDLEHPYIMVLVKLEFDADYRKRVGEVSKHTFFLTELISLYAKEIAPEVAAFQISGDEIGFVVDAATEMKPLLALLKEKLASETEYARFTFVVSSLRGQKEPVKAVYESLRGLSRYQVAAGKKTRVIYESADAEADDGQLFSERMKHELVEKLQNDSVEACTAVIFSWMDRAIEQGGSEKLQLLCEEISRAVDGVFRDTCETIPEEVGSLADYLRFAQAVTPVQYRTSVASYMENAVTYLRMLRRYEDNVIGFILDYIDAHYAEDIYLSLFAEKLQLTSAYVSAYFKERMNVNLSDYVNRYRVKQAVHLMETTTLKSREIAEKVGIPNVNTFIRLFKKHIGTTPGEYRKQTVHYE